MESVNQQTVEPWKTRLVLEIARRKGFLPHEIKDAQQQVMLAVLQFRYDPATANGASERAVLAGLITNQLTMIERAEGRRRKHLKKIQQICGPSQYQPPTDDSQIEYERRHELCADVRAAVAELTPEEQAICQALAEGTPRYEIAARRGISRHEVNRIIKAIGVRFTEKNIDGWVR